jgi:hypothetical protein
MIAFRRSVKGDSITVAVHMRRGDIVLNKVAHQVEERRLVSFGTYKYILRQMLNVRAIGVNASLPIRIFFLCEGSRDSVSVLEYNQTELHKTYFLNVQVALKDICNSSNACSAEVLYQSDLLQSFAAMCESDVLITGTSGFSFVAAALCEPRMTIAVPLYNRFDNIRYRTSRTAVCDLNYY